MKLLVLNDLHVEFEGFDPPATDADVVILAGDIHVGTKGLAWARKKFPSVPVIYVLGNHEYYGEALPKHTDKLKDLAKGSNIHILENDRLDLDGVVFLGTTLWTDFRLFGDPRHAGYEASQRVTDFRKIRVSPQFRKFRSLDAAAIHLKSLSWLREELVKCKGRKTVVVTHHAPSQRSIPDTFKDDIISAAYASHLDDLVEGSGAVLWAHGHIHAHKDYMIGDTRVVCNSRGYPDETNIQFMPDFIVEV